ncbi:probable low-specificity L-threonine aldolase 2 [Diachasma alloeum]|uniref:probable low-specificity L-threonine aldolase 2 n=1 Tax=Diachasma alloeum TaxID=454923 RepID=UPI0007384FF7|nr:probable low-specificity L-threonine aldolase 2 [Diachasma alloeum]XP_015111215.1 probable low-specificity L-threonine aldolase 2 [Diachasma alloeum]
MMTVDLRTDTITKPCLAMRQAMFDAEVGDDVYREDPTVIKLEEYVAELMGKEAALFVTSGTMANLVSIMVHCDTRGCEMYADENSHLVLNEQGCAAQIAGVTLRPFSTNPDGTFDLEKLRGRLRNPAFVQSSISRLISVENTVNGAIVPMKFLKEVVEFGRRHGLKLHMDGSRVWHSAMIPGTPIKEIVDGFDSVSFCLTKLGAPVGSMLSGSREFILQARRARKVLGGGMRQVGVLAACGFVALENRFKLVEDHQRAVAMMEAINELGSDVFRVDVGRVQTNMVWIDIEETEGITATGFAKRLGETEDDHEDDRVKVLAWSVLPSIVRLVFHLEVTDEGLQAATRKVRYLVKKMDPKFKVNSE